jgi:hypothetical protein
LQQTEIKELLKMQAYVYLYDLLNYRIAIRKTIEWEIAQESNEEDQIQKELFNDDK